jgi:N-acetylmuramic acid 6-phosphate etherase
MDRSKLTTEKRNPRTKDIDKLSTIDIVKKITGEDMLIAPAVAKQSRQIAQAVEKIVSSFRQGGRLFYVGAGTSGRLGVLDASECPPTYGVDPKMVQGIIAGGKRALVRSVEGAEDSADSGKAALIKKKLKSIDSVVGIAACGVTPFVHGAMAYANELGCATIFVTCAPQAKKHIKTDVIINPVVGPEVITGSTRMKAGTATKLVLNTLTTSSMIKIGKVYGNLMVDLRATNSKLRDRSERIIIAATGVTKPLARKLLAKANGHAKAAIAMYYKKIELNEAQQLLEKCGGSLRKAIGK